MKDNFAFLELVSIQPPQGEKPFYCINIGKSRVTITLQKNVTAIAKSRSHLQQICVNQGKSPRNPLLLMLHERKAENDTIQG